MDDLKVTLKTGKEVVLDLSSYTYLEYTFNDITINLNSILVDNHDCVYHVDKILIDSIILKDSDNVSYNFPKEYISDMRSLDKNLIHDYCLDFYGYGNPEADYWFVGMEEGGVNTITDFYDHYIRDWGKEASIDILTGINQEAKIKYFSEGAKIQRTWGRLIRIILSIKNQKLDIEIIRNFQKDKLGRIEGNNFLLELLPLPNKNMSEWLYGCLGIPTLMTREIYSDFYLQKRIEGIQNLIVEGKPKVVIFYSTTPQYVTSWKSIIGSDCEITDGLFIRKFDDVIFCICKHPAARGLKNDYFDKVGNKIRTLL
jgi:hypothetical protein